MTFGQSERKLYRDHIQPVFGNFLKNAIVSTPLLLAARRTNVLISQPWMRLVHGPWRRQPRRHLVLLSKVQKAPRSTFHSVEMLSEIRISGIPAPLMATHPSTNAPSTADRRPTLKTKIHKCGDL